MESVGGRGAKNQSEQGTRASAPLVAVVRTRPDTVLVDVDRLIGLARVEQALQPHLTTILKDNISWHFPFPGANTTPWQLEGTIRALRSRGYEDQVCVQNKTVVTDAFKGEDLNGYIPIFEHYDVRVRYNFKDDDMRWVRYEPQTRMRVLHDIYPAGIFIPDYFFGKNIVHLPTVKCHIYTTTTGAMKNAFGGLLNTKRHYTHSWIHETLVDLLAIQQEIHPGILAVMDGTTAGDGPGPRTMHPRQKDVLLASEDQVAIDSVAAKLMGFEPLSIPYIRLAHEQGLGCGDVREITLVGDDISMELAKGWGFAVGKNTASFFGDLLWFSPLKLLQRFFFRTPLVNLFILGSEAYHDYYRWPVHDRAIYDSWMHDSPWGNLFAHYQREGLLSQGDSTEKVSM